MTSPAAPAPYRGLRPFEDSEADVQFFFGRERERELIIANLMASRLTVLYGETGVGKSSVLQAGVAHHLRALAHENLEQNGRPELAVVVFDSWQDDPVLALERAVEKAAREALGRSVELPRARTSLADRMQDWTALLDGQLYLLLDQTEEYFLYHRGEHSGESFAGQLPQLVGRGGLRVNVLLALREDALARLDVFKARIPSLFGNYLRLDHLDRAAARRAVLGPIEQYNRLVAPESRVEIEPALVESLLDEIAAGKVELGQGKGAVETGETEERIETPYLQLVMQRLWETEHDDGSRVLRLTTFRDLGGAEQILRAHLGRALDSLSPTEQDIAASMFDHLVTPTGTKIGHSARDLAGYARVDEVALVPVLSRLAGERILRPVAAADGSGGTRYEIFHDVLGEPVLVWKTDRETSRALEIQRAESARRQVRMRRLVAAAVIAFVAMAGLTVFALSQRSDARAQARVAASRELAASAISQLSIDPELGLLLALRGAQLEPTAQAEDALRQALIASRVRAVLTGSTKPERSAVFSPDGRLVVTAGQDGTARVYDSRGGPALHALGHGRPVTIATFSPDGKLILTASRDSTVRLWNVSSGGLLHVLHPGGIPTEASFSADGALVLAAAGDVATVFRTASGRQLDAFRQPSPVTSAGFGPGGPLVVTGGIDGTARIWRVGRPLPVHVLRAGGPIAGVAFSPNGGVVLTTLHMSVRLWQTKTGGPAGLLVDREPSGAPTQVQGAAFSPDGSEVATWSVDGGGRVYEVATGRRTVILFGHTGYVNDLAFRRDGRWLVTASSDRTARIWQAADGQPGLVLVGHSAAVNSAVFSSAGSRVVTASEDGTARVWDPGILPALRLVGRHGGPVETVAVDPDGQLAASAGADGTVRVWRLRDRVALHVFREGGDARIALFSPDGATVLGAGTSGVATLWDVTTGQRLEVLHHGAAISSAVFGPDGKLVVTGGADGTARLWRVSDGSLVERLRHGAPVTAVAVSPDGKRVLTAGANGVARLWHTDGGALSNELGGHRGPIVRASFSPDGRVVVTAGADGTARLWSVDSGSLLHELRGHTDALTDAEFSPDGKLVLTASRDHDERIWDVASGALVHLLRGHFALVNGASFSPDGRWVVTAGPGTAGLWPTESGRLLAYLRGPKAPLTAAVFASDGRTIVTASLDGTVRRYLCEVCGTTEQVAALAQQRLAATRRTFTPGERARFLHG
jgi:WD40 repeat protein